MPARLSEFESDILNASCESNEKITIKFFHDALQYVYLSRFLAVDSASRSVIVDEPSAQTPGALPLAKGEEIEIFFEFRTFRYLFSARILEHVKFNLNNRQVHAFRITMPTGLRDGERREYFRVEVSRNQTLTVNFNIYSEGKNPVKSDLIANMNEEFQGEILDISGGGFAFRGSHHIELLKGDLICARFRMKPDIPEFEVWCEVCSKRKSQIENENIWGVSFLKEDKNPNLRSQRNAILRYVLERQREVLFK